MTSLVHTSFRQDPRKEALVVGLALPSDEGGDTADGCEVSPVQEPAPVPRTDLPPQPVFKGILCSSHCLVNITDLGQGHLADDLWWEQRYDTLPWLCVFCFPSLLLKPH